MVYFLSEETTSGDASVVTSPQHIDCDFLTLFVPCKLMSLHERFIVIDW